MEFNMQNQIFGDILYSEYIDIIPVVMGMDYEDENEMLVSQCILNSSKENFEKVYIDNRYYNMDKESSFLKLEELKDKTIQVNNRIL